MSAYKQLYQVGYIRGKALANKMIDANWLKITKKKTPKMSKVERLTRLFDKEV